MSRRIDRIALSLPPRHAGASAHRWLCSALRSAILDGRLKPGSRLPATRDLASRYRLSRGTIVTAFEQMKSEGYITGRVGSGTYVNTFVPDALLEVARPQRATGAVSPNQPRRWSALAS